MGGIFGGGPSIEVQAPPPVPPPPELAPEEVELRQLNIDLLRQNIDIQTLQREEEAATRTAIEEALGLPFEEILSQQAVAEFGLATDLREQQQTALARQEQERQDFFEATGLTPEEFSAEEAGRQVTLSRAFGERFEKALAGELELDPGLERQFAQEQTDLEEIFRRQLGTGFRLSTPFIQAQSELQKRQDEIRFAAQRGEITRAEQIGFARSPTTQQLLAARSGLAAGLPNQSPFGFASGLSTLGQGFLQTPQQAGPLTSAFQFDRGLQADLDLAGFNSQVGFTNALNQARISSASARTQSQAGLLGALISAGGFVAGSGLFGGGGGGGGSTGFQGGGLSGSGSFGFPGVGTRIG